MRTKIIATIGPASSDLNTLRALAAAGVSIFRLNFSHGEPDFFRQVVRDIRAVEQDLNTPLTVMQDLSGPKIRLGALAGGTLTVQEGELFNLGDSEMSPQNGYPLLPFEHFSLLADLRPGDKLVLADGGLEFVVQDKVSDRQVIIRALGAGLVTSRKGLAIPGKPLNLPALTDKDKKDLEIGIALGVDAVAISFVQSAEDVRQAKALIRAYGSYLPVVAKLERQSALDNLDAILAETDMIMVARGDLGVETPLPQLPALQKRVIKACNKASKPVIVATQMLLSMVSSPSPTRAETTDVANAVLDGADCVMLSEETAMGEYPVATVKYMRQITAQAEEYLLETRRLQEPEASSGAAEYLAYAACLLADKIGAIALAAHSMSGSSARMMSARRPAQTIYALSPDARVVHTLNFSWGVQPFKVLEDPEISHSVRVQRFIASNPTFPVGEDIVFTAGEPSPGQANRGTNLVKIYRK